MKLLVVLSMLVVAVAGGNKCVVNDGHHLHQFGGRELKLKVPCKYNAILQDCGNYRVTVTPGHRYLFPTYIMNSVWLSVVNIKTGQYWEGRTTNKVAALYIINGGKNREAFNQKGGNYTTSQLLKESFTSHDITVTEKSGAFSLTVGPFDFNGNMAGDSRMEFECKVDNEPNPYPLQFCGDKEGNTIKSRTEELFKNKKRVEWTILYDIFTDKTIVQNDGACKDTTDIMLKQCKTVEQRKDAITTCHLILDSDGHTQCVFRDQCDPMVAFKNCVQYVCSDFTDNEACENVGRSIDMCRLFPRLTTKIQEANCYKDFLTREDNPYYTKGKSAN